MTQPTDLANKRAALLARATDQVLIASLTTLDAIRDPSPEERMVRAWTIDELENRYPTAAEAVEFAFAAADADGSHVDYVAVLLAAIRKGKGTEGGV